MSELRAITAQLPGIVTSAGKVKNYRLKTLQTRIAGADVKTPFYILRGKVAFSILFLEGKANRVCGVSIATGI
jgi:hypothetical protein